MRQRGMILTYIVILVAVLLLARTCDASAKSFDDFERQWRGVER